MTISHHSTGQGNSFGSHKQCLTCYYTGSCVASRRTTKSGQKMEKRRRKTWKNSNIKCQDCSRHWKQDQYEELEKRTWMKRQKNKKNWSIEESAWISILLACTLGMVVADISSSSATPGSVSSFSLFTDSFVLLLLYLHSYFYYLCGKHRWKIKDLWIWLDSGSKSVSRRHCAAGR